MPQSLFVYFDTINLTLDDADTRRKLAIAPLTPKMNGTDLSPELKFGLKAKTR
jgi:hypothetical protein